MWFTGKYKAAGRAYKKEVDSQTHDLLLLSVGTGNLYEDGTKKNQQEGFY